MQRGRNILGTSQVEDAELGVEATKGARIIGAYRLQGHYNQGACILQLGLTDIQL